MILFSPPAGLRGPSYLIGLGIAGLALL